MGSERLPPHAVNCQMSQQDPLSKVASSHGWQDGAGFQLGACLWLRAGGPSLFHGGPPGNAFPVFTSKHPPKNEVQVVNFLRHESQDYHDITFGMISRSRNYRALFLKQEGGIDPTYQLEKCQSLGIVFLKCHIHIIFPP